jgi:hypothetical protein
VEYLQRGVSILAATPGGPGDLGEVRLLLAQALWSSRKDRKAATALADQAIKDYAAAKNEPERARAERWWRSHGGRR